jgi:hypothetical protein
MLAEACRERVGLITSHTDIPLCRGGQALWLRRRTTLEGRSTPLCHFFGMAAYAGCWVWQAVLGPTHDKWLRVTAAEGGELAGSRRRISAPSPDPA